MAEIKIEKKTSIWLWLLIAFIIIGAIVAYFALTNTNDDTSQATAITAPDTTAQPTNTPVAAYIQYVEANRSMGLDHTYTNEALTRLTEAINAKAQQVGYNISADLEKVKEHANSIQQDPFETSHANSIRKAADILAGAMQNMQQAKYPNLTNEAAEVRTAANNINPDVLTLDQRDAVKAFFQEAAGLLQNMN